MASQQAVLDFVATFKGVSVSDLHENATLGLSSLSAQRFRVALKRKFGVEIPERDFKTIHVGDVLQYVEGGPLSTKLVETLAVTPSTGVAPEVSIYTTAVGVDMEPVQEFRASKDVQSDEFYQSIFTPAEMGYCLLQADPPQHFTARFCAKEALRKCGPEYKELAFNQIQVSHRPDGSPFYTIPHLGISLDGVSLSLSHTEEMAIAVAVKSMNGRASTALGG